MGADSSTVIHRHVLATGFSAVSDAQGTASPGDAIPFYATTAATDAKPLLLVSADNGNYLCVLVPDAPKDPRDWTYSKQMIEYIGADVGRPAIGDVDGDGYNELYVPAYDAGQVLQYKAKAPSLSTSTSPIGRTTQGS